MNRSIPEVSIDTTLLYERISKAKRGETITYDELNEIIGRNTQREGRGFLYTARNMALRNDRLVFEAVRGVGIKCLTDEENANSTGGAVIKRIRRAASVGIKKLVAVEDFEAMENGAKIKHNTALSILGATRQFLTPKKVKMVEETVSDIKKKLSFQKTIGLFK